MIEKGVACVEDVTPPFTSPDLIEAPWSLVTSGPMSAKQNKTLVIIKILGPDSQKYILIFILKLL